MLLINGNLRCNNCQSRFATGRPILTAREVGFEEYGFKKKFNVDKNHQVKLLITGAGSYVGESFKEYTAEHYPNIEVTIIDMVNDSWREHDFGSYGTVFHVAGIAHADVDNVDEATKAKYYAVNTDLAIETAQKARRAGVRQFIFMSSIIVYGGVEYIDEDTLPHPVNFYGDSKWRADKGIRELADSNFNVAVLRTPMIYGKGCKGNYLALAKVAKKTPVFPDYNNKRSMLYIENLCEFVSLLSFLGEGGIYFPQNSSYTKTSEMVKNIGKIAGSPVKTMPILNPFVLLANKIPGKIGKLAKKAFSSSCYDQKLSKYDGLNYQIVSFEESIKRTESKSFFPKAGSKEKNPLISIITVCFNSEDVIDKTISSVLHQLYDKIEYIIIDGASRDNTVQIAEKYRKRFRKRGYKYTIISEPDKGIYDAMNKGIKYASGVLIGYINAGDWYEKDAVRTVAEEYGYKPFDYFYADVNLIRADGSIIVKHSRKDRIVTSRHWNHPSSFATRKLYEELGGFKCEGIHDDFEFYLRVRKAGKNIRIMNRVLANFRTGGISNVKSAVMCKKRIKDRYRGYRENGYSLLYVVECVAVEVAKYLIS